ncbi:UNVERIFIED_CONTAM: hypothetical protein Slati_3078900, partial [Sesamum latifolium]
QPTCCQSGRPGRRVTEIVACEAPCLSARERPRDLLQARSTRSLVHQVAEVAACKAPLSLLPGHLRPLSTATCCGRDLEVARARCEQQACCGLRSVTTRASP